MRPVRRGEPRPTRDGGVAPHIAVAWARRSPADRAMWLHPSAPLSYTVRKQERSAQMRRVVVTGLGIVSSIGNNRD